MEKWPSLTGIAPTSPIIVWNVYPQKDRAFKNSNMQKEDAQTMAGLVGT